MGQALSNLTVYPCLYTRCFGGETGAGLAPDCRLNLLFQLASQKNEKLTKDYMHIGEKAVRRCEEQLAFRRVSSLSATHI